MKIRIVSSKDETHALNPNERMVHMAFRASPGDAGHRAPGRRRLGPQKGPRRVLHGG